MRFPVCHCAEAVVVQASGNVAHCSSPRLTRCTETFAVLFADDCDETAVNAAVGMRSVSANATLWFLLLRTNFAARRYSRALN